MSAWKWRLGAAAILVAVLLGRTGPVAAQQYPQQDVHFNCAFAAGSGADVIVRFLADKMRPMMGRPIIVENKPGALGNIATEYVARSKPDGYTVYLTGGSALSANQRIMKNPTVDIGKALQAVGTINRQPVMIAVRNDSPWKAVPELTAAMKEKGDRASYATANPTAKVVGALYKERAGLQAVDVSYRAAADYLNDLTGGNVDYAIPDNVLAVTQARAGRMRILAVSTGERMQSAPEYLTMTELGYPMDIRGWWAAFVPAGTPRPVIDQLNKWLSAAVGSEEGKAFFANIASDAWVSTVDDTQAYFSRQIDDWGEYTRIAKIEQQG